jgi:hypothetical protein
MIAIRDPLLERMNESIRSHQSRSKKSQKNRCLRAFFVHSFSLGFPFRSSTSASAMAFSYSVVEFTILVRRLSSTL